MTEQEEFEFRLRLERERGESPAKPAKPELQQRMENIGGAILAGAGSIGSTMLEIGRTGPQGLGGASAQSLPARVTSRQNDIEGGAQALGADPQSLLYKGVKLGTEVAGTLGTGGALSRAVPAALPALRQAIASSGMSAGGAGMGTRVAGGALTGAAAASLVDPASAPAGMVAGGALPLAMAAAGKAGQAIGGALRNSLTPETAALARRAKELGIDVPVDRLYDSKPLNAVASGLNYVPFSGRAGVESKMAEQLNRAASRTIGQDTPNMTKALRDASVKLGAEFDSTLKQTGLAVDKQFLDDIADVFNTAERELGSDLLKPIAAQIDELMAKAGTGTIDGQAAYNIKRTLDRIGRQNTPSAFHALELKRVLMDGLNRSLGDDGAKAFAKTRQQYGNMLALEKLAKNGVEGEISVARLANLPNINNQPLQEIADIAAQFVKPREGQHGAMQRAAAGIIGTMAAGPGAMAAGAAAGRGVNALMNSRTLTNTITGFQQPNALARMLGRPDVQENLLRAFPVLAADR
jgi:hypothetical protein